MTELEAAKIELAYWLTATYRIVTHIYYNSYNPEIQAQAMEFRVAYWKWCGILPEGA